MSLRLKLTIIFLAVTLIPLLFVSGIMFNNYKSSLESARLSELLHLSAVKADRIEAYFAELRLFVEFCGNSYVVNKNLPILNKLLDKPADSEFKTAKEMLDNLLRIPQKALNLSDIMLVNNSGKVVYASSPGHYAPEFSKTLSEFESRAAAEGRDKIYFSDIFLKNEAGPGLLPEMLITAPVLDPAGVTGVIVVVADMRPIFNLIQETSGMGNTGEVLIGKREGSHAVFLNTLRHDPGAALNRRVVFGDKIGFGIQEAVQGRAGSGHTIDYRGKPVIAAWRHLPSIGWGMVAKIDTEEALRDVSNLGYLVIVILMIVLALGGVTAFSIAQSIVKPIKDLSRGAEIIGGGNLDYKVGTDLKDEVGQLARSFDRMAADLKASFAMRDAERKRLYEVLETLPVYVVLLDSDYRVPFANKFFRARFGESHGKRCHEYLFNRGQPCENCETYKVMKTRAPHHWEWTGPDNRNYDIYDFPFTDSDGSMMIMEMGIDITLVKKAEKELRDNQKDLEVLVRERTNELAAEQRNLRTIFDVVNVGMLLIDEEGNVNRVNDVISRWVGRDFESMRGSQPGDALRCIHAAEDPSGCGHTAHCGLCPIRSAFKTVLSSGRPVHDIETEMTLAEGGREARMWLDISADPIAIDGRKHVIIAMNDITERKKAEKVLRRDKDLFEKQVKERTEELISAHLELDRARRLSDIGTLAATVAHELRNPLAAMLMAAANIRRKAKNPDLDKHLLNIEKKVAESEQIINNLLFYSRIKPPTYASADLSGLIEECVDSAREKSKKWAVFENDTGRIKGLPIKVDTVQIKEVMNNLLNNAVDALPETDGKILIKAEDEGSRVAIHVNDNGSGIAEGHLDRIFDPFFTTKAKGTGLGLSVCRQIIDFHGGSIGIDSKLGKGTTVVVRLPKGGNSHE